MVVDSKQGRVIAKLGDFDGIAQDGAPVGFLWPNSLVFYGDDVLVTNLSLQLPSKKTVDSPWAAEVTTHTVSKIKKRIPNVSK